MIRVAGWSNVGKRSQMGVLGRRGLGRLRHIQQGKLPTAVTPDDSGAGGEW